MLAISGCSHAPEFPTKTIWEVDMGNSACGEYRIDLVTQKKTYVKDWPIEKCDGVFGFSTEDVPKVFQWVSDMKTYCTKHCK